MFQSDPRNRSAAKSSIRTPSAKHVESVQDFVSPCHASREDSRFKENFDVNKSVTPKLNMEPLQMKRKKKGGGYNLRKSLAWDRAFFTEEGVLDPLELSTISGASCGEGLPGINEVTPGSSHKPGNFQELRNNICKDFSDEDLCKERRKPCLSPKLDPSSSNTMTSQKIKARFGNKSESSSSGFHRHVSSSSLKRPANVNNFKAALKEIKLQKVPSLKTGSTPVRTSKCNIPRPSCVNPIQIAQPASSIRTNGVLRSSSKSLKTTQTASKAGSLGELYCHPERNPSNSSFKGHPSINMSQIPAARAHEDSDSKKITVNTTPPQPEYTWTSVSLARHAHDSGLNMHRSQNLIIKPSCLRMPSPSLSFFSQPKASVLHDLSPRDTDWGICGSLKPGSLRLQDTLRTTPKIDNNVQYSTTSSTSMAISSRSGCLVPPHVNDASSETVKSKLERNSTQMVEMKVLGDALNSDLIGYKPIEDHIFDRQTRDHSKKNVTERISPQEEVQSINNRIPSQDVIHKRVVDQSQSCNSGWRYPELISEHNQDIYGSERESAIRYPHKEPPSMSIFDVVNHNASINPNCGNAIDIRGQNSLAMAEKTCQANCHEPEKSDQLYSPVAADNATIGDRSVLKTNEIATELLGGSPQSETRYIGGKNTESKHQHECFTDEAVCVDAVTAKLLGIEVNMQNAEHASTDEGCENYLDLISDVGDDTQLSETRSEVHTVCLEVYQESQRNDETIDLRWQDENDLKSHEPNAVLLHNISNERLSDDLYQATQKVELDNCSSFHVTRTYEVSPKKFLENVNGVIPTVNDNDGNSSVTSNTQLNEEGTDMDEQSSKAGGNLQVQSPSVNELCSNQSESLELLNDELVDEILSHSNDGLNIESLFLRRSVVSDESCEDEKLGSLVDSFEIGDDTLRKSFVCTQAPLEHESCIVADQIDSQPSNFDEAADSSRVKPLLDPSKVEGSKDASDSIDEIQPESNPLQSKVEPEQNNNHEDGLNAKSQMLVIPQNAVPFSDEWLAAIEAAGEDILTKKGGAVQNSPTEKTLPAPSPWSPVKRRNNQIGPFDCTKYTNILPSDSN